MSTRLNPQIARRYAAALFAVVPADKQNTTLEEFKQLLVILSEPHIKRVFFHPFTPAHRKNELIRLINLSQSLEHFVLLTLEKSRENFLTQIEAEFERLVFAAQGMTKAEVISAVPLQANTKEQLQARLEARSGKKVLLHETVDPRIGGGLVVKMEGKIIDGSVANILTRFQREILQ